jgi:hypothetical protein
VTLTPEFFRKRLGKGSSDIISGGEGCGPSSQILWEVGGRINLVAFAATDNDLDEEIIVFLGHSPFDKHTSKMPSQSANMTESPRHSCLARPASYVVRAARSAFYPIKGVWYFLRRPYFYPLFGGRLLPLSIISLLVYFALFTFAFLPQLAFLAIFQGWAAACINATTLVLAEGLVVIQGIFEGFFVDECRVDVFDVSLPAELRLVTPPDPC